MITENQRALRNAVVDHATANNPEMDSTTEGLIRVLGSVIEGIPVEQAFGAPGSWGYETAIGDALLARLRELE